MTGPTLLEQVAQALRAANPDAADDMRPSRDAVIALLAVAEPLAEQAEADARRLAAVETLRRRWVSRAYNLDSGTPGMLLRPAAAERLLARAEELHAALAPPRPPPGRPPGLTPAEQLAVTVATAQAERGGATGPHTTAMLLLTIERLATTTGERTP